MEQVKTEIPPPYNVEVCRFCLSLSTNRKLTDVQCVLFAFNLVTDWESAEGVRVCWECRARLRNIHVFKLQAEWAKQMLFSVVDVQGLLETSSASKLTADTKTAFDREYNEDDIEIKIEPEDYDERSFDDCDIANPQSTTGDVWTEPVQQLEEENSPEKKEKKRRGRPPKETKGKKKRKYVKRDKAVKAGDIDDAKYVEEYTVSEEELKVYKEKILNLYSFKNSKFKCTSCFLRFESLNLYKKHVDLHSEASGKHECDVCGCRFSRSMDLLDHRRAHFVLLRCLRAGCTFQHHQQKYMKRHQTAHRSNQQNDIYSTERYECDYCGRSYKIRKQLCSHIKCAHRRRAVCEVCGYRTTDACMLRKHKLAHLDPSFRPFGCDVCSKRFTSKHQLAVHTRIHTGERFICETCGKGFRDVYNLKYHNRTRHGIGEPKNQTRNLQPRTKSYFINYSGDVTEKNEPKVPRYLAQIGDTQEYKCYICHKVIPFDDIPYHCIMHRKQKTFECKDCGKMFNDFSNFKTHLIARHSEERPHQCLVCGSTFKLKSNLKIHMVTHSEEKPFKCDQCSSTFKRRGELRTHKLHHKGDKPHQCNICGVRFLMKGNLNRHMKVHTKDYATLKTAPYECTICGQTFPWKRNLTNHLKVHEMDHQTPLTQL